MKRQQAVSTHQQIKQYMEKNKVRAFFGDILRQVVLKKPDNPIQYIINYLDKRPSRLTVCLQGYDNENRKKLAKIICNKLNFKLIELSDIYSAKDYHTESDSKINQKVLSQLKAAQSQYKGIIISGYPNNIQQVDFIQKSPFLPDRYFSLPYETDKIKAQIAKIYPQSEVDNILKRQQMENKQIKEGLGELLDDLPVNVDEAAEILSYTFSMKVNKKHLPYDSPRVFFIHPPHLRPPSLNTVAKNFSLHHVNIPNIVIKLSQKQNFKDYVEKYIRKSGGLSKQIEIALIQTQCKSAPAKNKGYLLSGWPKNISHLNFMKEKFLKPHIIFVFTLDQQASQENFAKLQAGDPSLFQVSPKPSLEDFKRELREYEKLVDHLKENYKIQIMPWGQPQKQVNKTFQSLIDNSKVYW